MIFGGIPFYVPPVFHLEFRGIGSPVGRKISVGFSTRIYRNLCVTKLVGVGMME